MITVVIIEDEPAIRREITYLMQQEEDVTLVGWAGSVQHAVDLIQAKKPDVILMDIQLKDGTAFDLLNKLSPVPQHIIFITAYNHFAIKAIKFGALDYLLKPVDKAELQEALERYRRRKQDNPDWMLQLSISQQALEEAVIPECIALASVNKVQVVPVNQVIYCKSDGPYTCFYLKDGSQILMSKPLKYYQELLPSPFFLRTHQCYLVNRDYIAAISRDDQIVLLDGLKIPISSRRKNIIVNCFPIKK